MSPRHASPHLSINAALRSIFQVELKAGRLLVGFLLLLFVELKFPALLCFFS